MPRRNCLKCSEDFDSDNNWICPRCTRINKKLSYNVSRKSAKSMSIKKGGHTI
jgi:hypothetical protein